MNTAIDSTLEWIDTHAHLNHEYPFSIDVYIQNAKQNGIQKIVTIGTEQADFNRLHEIAQQFDCVYYTVGVHPHEAKTYSDDIQNELLVHLKNPKCLAVGEIGLDYFYEHSSSDEQKAALKAQLDIALQVHKPVVIHSRDAEDDLQKELEIFSTKWRKNQTATSSTTDRSPGVIHCFSGSRNFALSCLKMGFYISLSGITTFKNANELRSIIKDIPIEKLLLETDAPFLAPVPYRGKPNQSAYLIETAKTVAGLKNISLKELSVQTVKNAYDFFQFQN